MASPETNFVEIQRRAFFWTHRTTLDDGQTALTFDADPNTAVAGNSPGEDKIIAMLDGAFYYQSNKTLWLKVDAETNKWIVVSEDDPNNGNIRDNYDDFIGDKEFIYNTDGNLDEIKLKSTTGELVFSKKIWYNLIGDVSKIVITDYRTNYTLTTDYIYDLDGNLVNKIDEVN